MSGDWPDFERFVAESEVMTEELPRNSPTKAPCLTLSDAGEMLIEKSATGGRGWAPPPPPPPQPTVKLAKTTKQKTHAQRMPANMAQLPVISQLRRARDAGARENLAAPLEVKLHLNYSLCTYQYNKR